MGAGCGGIRARDDAGILLSNDCASGCRGVGGIVLRVRTTCVAIALLVGADLMKTVLTCFHSVQVVGH